jgi:hypothetical protein
MDVPSNGSRMGVISKCSNEQAVVMTLVASLQQLRAGCALLCPACLNLGSTYQMGGRTPLKISVGSMHFRWA